MRIPDRDEADLVERARGRDREAFGALVERYALPVRRLARAVLRHAEDADDAAQDAFLAAWEKLDRFDPKRGGFGPWLLAIAVHAAMDRSRRRAVRRTEALDENVADRNDPERDLAQRLLEARVGAALETLPERQRLAVVLFDLEGYAHAEIAAILGVPEGTVRSDVHHARRRLRDALADWKETEP